MANAFDYLEGEDDAGRLQRFQRDYHSADRDAVLKDLQGGSLNSSVGVSTAPGGGALPPSPSPQVRGPQQQSTSPMPASASPTPSYQVPRIGMPQAPQITTPTGNTGGNYRGTEDSWIGWLRGGGGGAKEGRNGFFNSNVALPDLIAQYNAATGGQAKFIGGPSGDMVDFGDGRGPVDARTAQGEFWYNEGGANPFANQSNAGGGGGGNPDGGGVGGPGQSSTGLGGDLDPTFRAALLQLMQGGTRNPGLDAVETSYRNERNRGAQQERGALAERAAFEGLNSGGQGAGAFDTGIQGINEDASQDIAGNTGQMEFQDYQQRRQQLMQALDLANAVGARNEANALQMQLAQMDQQYRYASLNQNQSQWNDRYGLDLADLQQRSDRQAYLDLMGG